MRCSITVKANGCGSEQQPRRQVESLGWLLLDEREIGRNGDPFTSFTAVAILSFT
jgi:hypothetical protein